MKTRRLFGLIVILSLMTAACSLVDLLPKGLVDSFTGEEEAVIEDTATEIGESTEPTAAVPTETKATETVVTETEPTVEPVILLSENVIQEESEEPLYEIDIAYPLLEGNKTVVSSFNAEMDMLVEVVLDVFKNDVAEREDARAEDAMQATSTLAITYHTTYRQYPLVSIYLPITTYLAISPSPATTSFAYNYDASRGQFIFLGDLFLPDADYQGAILTAVEAALLDRDFGYQPGTAAEVLQRRPNWNILPEGLRINFDAYEVGPGAAGPQMVLIPWEELSDLLDPEGPIGFVIAT
jgi:hypothetical protein